MNNPLLASEQGVTEKMLWWAMQQRGATNILIASQNIVANAPHCSSNRLGIPKQQLETFSPQQKENTMITRRIGSKILQQQAFPSAKTIATRTAGVRRCFQSTKPSASQSSSIFNAANDYFSSLRWKAAGTLTSSLAEEERNQLMQKLEPKFEDKHSEKDNHVPERSIDEAVAAARAQEVELHQQKWEDQKEQLLQEAEEAARARVESDLLIQKRQLAFEAWKRDLEKETNQSTTTSITTAAAATQENVGDHPILGPVLYDLGHKRIHVASAKALASIPVWKKQRIYRHGRAKSMASDKMKTLHLGLPGIIGIYEVRLCIFFLCRMHRFVLLGCHLIINKILRLVEQRRESIDFGWTTQIGYAESIAGESGPVRF
jgi:hypothetical protein